MVRRHSLRYLLVLALSLVMTAGLIAPAVADSEGESVVVTARVLPYLEVSIDPTAMDLGQVPAVWDPTTAPGGFTGDWYAVRPFTVTVTSNLTYGSTMTGINNSTGGLAVPTHFSVWLDEPGSGFVHLVAIGSPHEAFISGEPALNAEQNRNLFLVLNQGGMPLPPGNISFAVIFTVSQVI